MLHSGAQVVDGNSGINFNAAWQGQFNIHCHGLLDQIVTNSHIFQSLSALTVAQMFAIVLKWCKKGPEAIKSQSMWHEKIE